MTAQQQSTGAGPIVALIIGISLALVALPLGVTGAVALVGATQLDRDGFLTSPAFDIETDAAVALSERFDVSGMEDWPFDDQLRLRATVEGSGEPVFVGVAPARELEDALAGVSRTRLSGSAPDAGQLTVPGGELDDAPEELVAWDAYEVGAGEQQLTWEPNDGEWLFAVLNADGSDGIDAAVRVGVDLPFFDLKVLGWTMLGIGLATGLVAVGLIVFGARGMHPRATEPFVV